MEQNGQARRRTTFVFAVWGAMIGLLWLADWRAGGRSQVEWPDRNIELLAMFAAHDRAERETMLAAAAKAEAAAKADAKAEELGSKETQIAGPDEAGGGKDVPRSGTTVSSGTGAVQSPPQKESTGARLDLNRATAAELDKLPGIGPSKAEAIVAYREQQGGFRNVAQLKEVKGIGAKTFATLEPLITVGE